MILLIKKLAVPSFEGFDKLLKKTRAFVKKKKLKPKDIEKVLRKI